MESDTVVQPATTYHDSLGLIIGLTVGTTLPLVHFLVGLAWIAVIAPRIKANRDARAWLDARYDKNSLRKLFIKFFGFLMWEFYCLGLIAYTTHAKVSLALSKRRERKQQRDENIELEEARPKVDDGHQSILSGPPPSYQSRRA